MKLRRILFGLGVLGLVASAVQPGFAGVEAEGGAYAGTTAGGWICGPAARANYGGLGARVRMSSRDVGDEHGSGWTGQVGLGAEYEHVHLTDPRCGDSCTPEDVDMPPDHILGGGYARAGYRWRWFGIEGGVGAYQGWEHNTDETPSAKLFPNARISTGPEESWTVFTGIGSEGVTTARRPAFIYVGGEAAVAKDQRVGLQGSWARQGPSIDDAAGPRVDASWRIPLSTSSYFRAAGGVSVESDSKDVGAEAAMGVGSVF